MVALWIDQGATWPEGLQLKPKKRIVKGADEDRIVEAVHAKIMATHKQTTEAGMKPYKKRIVDTLVDYEMVPIKGARLLWAVRTVKQGAPMTKGRNAR